MFGAAVQQLLRAYGNSPWGVVLTACFDGVGCAVHSKPEKHNAG
jgi:hypothetical protein